MSPGTEAVINARKWIQQRCKEMAGKFDLARMVPREKKEGMHLEKQRPQRSSMPLPFAENF
jgi:hypothetical protein